MNTDTPKELNIRISDYDNRWNKVAAELARPHLTGSYAPSSQDKTSKQAEPDSAGPSETKPQNR